MLILTTGDIGTITGTVGANLTGATARANIKAPDRTTSSHTLDITDAAAGEWRLDYAATDFLAVGSYDIEVEVTFSSGEIQTFAYGTDRQRGQFRVRKEIA